jgi:hypothetical protein
MRCSHTGISAVLSGAGSAGCAGVGFSRFVEVDFKGPEILMFVVIIWTQ